MLLTKVKTCSLKVSGEATVEGRSSSHLGKVRWCPHQQASNAACTYGSSILAYDLRTMKQAWTLDNAHSPIVRLAKVFFVSTCKNNGKWRQKLHDNFAIQF